MSKRHHRFVTVRDAGEKNPHPAKQFIRCWGGVSDVRHKKQWSDQRANARSIFGLLAARLKPCPDTNLDVPCLSSAGKARVKRRPSKAKAGSYGLLIAGLKPGASTLKLLAADIERIETAGPSTARPPDSKRVGEKARGRSAQDDTSPTKRLYRPALQNQSFLLVRCS